MTSSNNQNIDMLGQLQLLAIQGEPPETHRTAAWTVLHEAIQNEQLAARLLEFTITPHTGDSVPFALFQLEDAIAREQGRRRRKRWLGAVAAVFVVAVSLATVSLFIRAEPVTALGSIVEVVAALPPNEFGDTQLVRHVREERLVVSAFDETPIPALQPVTRTDRIDTDGRIERTETFGDPILLNPQDVRFLNDVRQELAAGTTITTVFEDPNTDEVLILTDSASTLSDRLRDQYGRWGDPAVPFEAYVLDRVKAIYLSVVPTPQQRAAILSTIDALTVIAQTRDDDGVTVTFQYSGTIGRERREMYFDNTGWLTEWSLTLVDGSQPDRIPPNTRPSTHLTAPQPADW